MSRPSIAPGQTSILVGAEEAKVGCVEIGGYASENLSER